MPLQLRKKTYASRVVVPRDLRRLVGKREVVRNLKTKKLPQARLRAAQWEGHVAALFQQLRRCGSQMESVQVDALVNAYLGAQLDQVEQRVAVSLPASDEAGRDVWRDSVVDELRRLEHALERGDTGEVLPLAREMMPTAADSALAVLARRLLEAKYESTIAELRALQGEPLLRWRVAHVSTGALNGSHRAALSGDAEEAIGAPTAADKTSPLLSVVLGAFVADRKRHWTAQTRLLIERRLRTVVELLGDKPIRRTKARSGCRSTMRT